MARTTAKNRGVVAARNVARDHGVTGAQTLVRGLEVIDAVARGAAGLSELSNALGLTRSTTHRLAGTLVEKRYLNYSRAEGYSLGPRLLELGYLARRQTSLLRAAHEHLEELAARTSDTVHLGILDENRVLYLDKIPGVRRVEISSRIGERQPLRSTGLGKALILDADEAKWRSYYQHEERLGFEYGVDLQPWLRRMRKYAREGCALDLEENEDRIRCVAAPLRDASGAIVGAISLSSAAQYMDDTRMRSLTFDVKRTAEAISRELGHNPAAAAVDAGEKKRAKGAVRR